LGNQKPDGQLAKSSFRTAAKLTSDFTTLRKRLGSNPALHIVSSGTRIKGILRDIQQEGGLHEIEFSQFYIAYTYYFTKPSKRTYSENLAKFIAILQFTSDLYTIGFNDLYQYVLEGIDYGVASTEKAKDQVTVRRLEEKVETLGMINISLSQKVIALTEQYGQVIERERYYRNMFNSFVKKIASNSNQYEYNLLIKDLGLDTDEVTKIIKQSGDDDGA
jgi:hypothetical protein